VVLIDLGFKGSTSTGFEIHVSLLLIEPGHCEWLTRFSGSARRQADFRDRTVYSGDPDRAILASVEGMP
jgi:hypothetical protein